VRAIGLIAVMLVAATAGCAGPPPPAAPPGTGATDPARGGARTGAWTRAESERDKMPIVWEFRDDYSAAAQRVQLIVVSQALDVPYVGQVDAALQQEFATREQRLRDALADKADLVAVLDWRQQHDWFFYADASVTRESVEAALGDRKGRDIRVSVEKDSEREFYTTLKQRVAAKP
jgi:hypothetical protein